MDQWVKTGLFTLVFLGVLNKLINISNLATGKGDILKTIPDNIFTIGIEFAIIAIVIWVFYKIGTGYVGETFNRRSFITLIIVTLALGAVYIFIIEPWTSDPGHLPVLFNTASMVNTQVQAFIAP